MDDYAKFIASKRVETRPAGFEIDRGEVNAKAFEYQKDMIQSACERGRMAMFLDCGLGKSLIEMEWGRLVWDHCGHDSQLLLLTPLAVGRQMVGEAEKFNIDCPVRRVQDQSECGPGVNIANYERLHLFDARRFHGAILDESSILKSYMGATKMALCEQFRDTPFRLCGTATPAPNDRMEIGNHSQFLGVMESAEMLMRWFTNDTMKAGGYRLSNWAVSDFWRWVASWAACVRRPSDLGYSDEGFILPPLTIKDYVVKSRRQVSGHLIDPGGKVSATNVHDAKREMLGEKAEIVAGLANGTTKPFVVWVDTDYEADAIRPLIPDCVEVRGSHSAQRKEEALEAFVRGDVRVLVTKPEIGGWGLNFQHCAEMTWFPSFSYESFYQCVRRFWRFGQTSPVTVHNIMSELEESVSKTADRKQAEHLSMQEEIVKWTRLSFARSQPKLLSKYTPGSRMEIPQFLRQRV